MRSFSLEAVASSKSAPMAVSCFTHVAHDYHLPAKLQTVCCRDKGQPR